MSKHAYLIIAHDNLSNLEKLIMMLDDERNDIYIHIDKKVKDFDFQRASAITKHSGIYFIDRMSVTWGGYSQIQCEMNLLKESVKNRYKYYHLLSGVDFPIKRQDYIHSFFEEHDGKEFIHFNDEPFNERIASRYKVYHPFQEQSGRNRNAICVMEKLIVMSQQFLPVDRTRNTSNKFCGGCNWFSITDGLANYVLSKQEEIRKMFRFTLCCDEVFLQTIVYNSPYFENVYDRSFAKNFSSCLRYIDWTRGKPYTFNTGDFEELLNAGPNYLFARKSDGLVIDEFMRVLDNAHNSTGVIA